MNDQRETPEVRRARARIARRVVAALIREKQSKVRLLQPRPTGLDEWMRANERSTRR